MDTLEGADALNDGKCTAADLVSGPPLVAHGSGWDLNENRRRRVTSPVLMESQQHGGGGSRTLVQTSSKNAFYMLSFLLIFERNPGKSTPVTSYPFYLIL